MTAILDPASLLRSLVLKSLLLKHIYDSIGVSLTLIVEHLLFSTGRRLMITLAMPWCSAVMFCPARIVKDGCFFFWHIKLSDRQAVLGCSVPSSEQGSWHGPPNLPPATSYHPLELLKATTLASCTAFNHMRVPSTLPGETFRKPWGLCDLRTNLEELSSCGDPTKAQTVAGWEYMALRKIEAPTFLNQPSAQLHHSKYTT